MTVRSGMREIDVTVFGLEWHELYAYIEGAKELPMEAEGDTVLKVYYELEHDAEEGLQLYVRNIVTTAPLVLIGGQSEHTIFAGVDVMPDMCEPRKRAIADQVEEILIQQDWEAA